MISNLPDGSTTLPISMTTRVADVDYETFYIKKTKTSTDHYSVQDMSYWHYCHDPRFDAYLVSIVTNDGFEWVGNPKDAPWDRIRDYIWVSHNKPFDGTVHNRLQELGIVPSWNPIYWGNSANLCAWVRAPRALAKAIKALYGIVHSKKIRDQDMAGTKWDTWSTDLQQAVCEYALQDSRLSLKIWMDHVDKWPARERRLADLLDARGLRGIYADREGMDTDIQLLGRIIFAAEQKIPWRNEEDAVILSKKFCAIECRKNGIEPPPSFDMKDEGLRDWEDQHGEKFPFVGAMRDWRRMNAILKKYQEIYRRIMPNGRFQFPVSYLGTHTGRTSGRNLSEDRTPGLNMLNLPRAPFYVRPDLTVAYRKDELKQIDAHFQALAKAKKDRVLPDGIAFEIDLRRKLMPAPGYKFVISDKAQIEARITNWLARETKALDLIRQGYSVYDTHAITMMGYVPEIVNDKPVSLKKCDPGQYALAKARELALGFQAGHIKFIEMAPTYVSDEEFILIFTKPVTLAQSQAYIDYLARTKQAKLLKEWSTIDELMKIIRVNSWLQVQDFRGKKPKLVALWKSLGEEFKASVGGTHRVELPSGRELLYFNVCSTKEGAKAQTEIEGEFKYFYGGKILENAVQATARDVFLEDQLNLEDAGIQVVLDVYDEVVTEVPVDFDEDLVTKIMCRSPEWAKSLPMGAESEVSFYYKK